MKRSEDDTIMLNLRAEVTRKTRETGGTSDTGMRRKHNLSGSGRQRLRRSFTSSKQMSTKARVHGHIHVL